jgi:hypothetical protein
LASRAGGSAAAFLPLLGVLDGSALGDLGSGACLLVPRFGGSSTAVPELEVSLSEEELSISLLLEEVLSESLEVEWLLEDESLESESESLEEEDEPAAAAAASCWAARILGSSAR